MFTIRWRSLCDAVLIAVAGAALSANVAPPELSRHASAIERNLHDAIVAFWLPRSIDEQHGGYHINFHLATEDRRALKLAHHLFETLERHAHDPEHGGYQGYFTPE